MSREGLKRRSVVSEHELPLAGGFLVAAEHAACGIADLDLVRIEPHRDGAVRGGRQRRIIGPLDLDQPGVVHRPDPLGEAGKARRRQRPQLRLLLPEQLQHLALRAAMNAQGGPALLPLRQPRVLRVERLERAAFQGRGLRVLDGALHRAFAIRIADPAGIRDHAVVREQRAVHRIQLRGVEVGPEHPLLQVVEHDVLRTASKRAPGLLVQLRPDLLIGLPDDLAETLARILERHDEQVRPLVSARRGARACALAVIDLRLLPRQELQHVEPLRSPRLQAGDKALDRIVAMGKPVVVDQVLIDADRIAPQPHLRLNPRSVGCTRRCGRGARWGLGAV